MSNTNTPAQLGTQELALTEDELRAMLGDVPLADEVPERIAAQMRDWGEPEPGGPYQSRILADVEHTDGSIWILRQFTRVEVPTAMPAEWIQRIPKPPTEAELEALQWHLGIEAKITCTTEQYHYDLHWWFEQEELPGVKPRIVPARAPLWFDGVQYTSTHPAAK